MRAPGPLGAEPSVARMVTSAAGPCSSFSRAWPIQSAIARPELRDRAENSLGRGGRIQPWQPLARRGRCNGLGESGEDRDGEHQGRLADRLGAVDRLLLILPPLPD